MPIGPDICNVLKISSERLYKFKEINYILNFLRIELYEVVPLVYFKVLSSQGL